MSRVLIYLARFAVIILGFVVASLAASAFINLLYLADGFRAEVASPPAAGSFVLVSLVMAPFVAYYAFIPSMIAILFAEILGAREWLIHTVAGGIIGAILTGLDWFLSSPGDYFGEIKPDSAEFLAIIAAGMVGGLFYWLVAGRSSGNWLREISAPSVPGPSGS